MIGPPIVTPNWFWSNCERGTPLSRLKKLLASKTVLRRYSYADPWKAFDPDLDVNVTTPPEKPPNSGLGTLVTTRLETRRAGHRGNVAEDEISNGVAGKDACKHKQPGG